LQRVHATNKPSRIAIPSENCPLGEITWMMMDSRRVNPCLSRDRLGCVNTLRRFVYVH
jgi:hypothetical protein